MAEFFQTLMGRKYYESDVPRIAKALERIAEQLEKVNEIPEALVKKPFKEEARDIKFTPEPHDVLTGDIIMYKDIQGQQWCGLVIEPEENGITVSVMGQDELDFVKYQLINKISGNKETQAYAQKIKKNIKFIQS